MNAGSRLCWPGVTETDVRAGIRHYADLDHDGLVGLSDIAAITTSWGRTGTGLLGDIDLDGLVGLSDIAVVTSNWGLSAPVIAAIPAPAGVLAFVFAGSFAARRRRASDVRRTRGPFLKLGAACRHPA